MRKAPLNPRPKRTPEEVSVLAKKIKELYESGKMFATIAKETGVKTITAVRYFLRKSFTAKEKREWAKRLKQMEHYRINKAVEYIVEELLMKYL